MTRQKFYKKYWVIQTKDGTFAPAHLGDKEKAFFQRLDEIEKSGIDLTNLIYKKNK